MEQWIIYTSPSIALAKLEILANEEHLPIRRVCMTIEVKADNSLFEVALAQLPIGWYETPYLANLFSVTSQFIKSGCLLMKVPSAQSMRESNYLINVRHPDFQKRVKMVDVQAEPLDVRLE